MSTLRLKLRRASSFFSKTPKSTTPKDENVMQFKKNFSITLPSELERLIFIRTAQDHEGAVPSLMLCCKRVSDWVGSVVYGIIVRQTLMSSPNWSNAQNPPSPAYIGQWAKKLAIGGVETEEVIQSYLANFRHLIDLALWTRIPTERFFKALNGLRLVRLSTKLDSLSATHLRKTQVWGSVTHLDITIFHPRTSSSSQTSATPAVQKEWKDLGHLPSLTHLAINELVTLEDISEILSACTKLELLVIFRHHFAWSFPPAGTASPSSPLRDPRVVLMTMKRYMVEEWYAGAVGERDFWQDAVQWSDARRRGENADGTEWLVKEVGLA